MLKYNNYVYIYIYILYDRTHHELEENETFSFIMCLWISFYILLVLYFVSWDLPHVLKIIIVDFNTYLYCIEMQEKGNSYVTM